MATSDIKPEYSFTEKDNEASFVLVIDGLKVERKLASGLSKQPKNALIKNQILNQQAINFAIELPSAHKTYRFQIQRLPTQINPEKTKIRFEKDQVIITLNKRENEPWRQYIDSDFETIHLVQRMG